MKQKLNVAIRTYKFGTGTGQHTRSKDYICDSVNNNCLSCGKDIQHPICPNCIAKAFDQWIRKFPEYQEVKEKLDIFMQQHNKIPGKSKKCILCGENRVNICPYCFTKYLYKLTKEAGMGVRAMSEFLFMFNFDFNHEGYSQELEAHGGY